jgi:hypothetical protein
VGLSRRAIGGGRAPDASAAESKPVSVGPNSYAPRRRRLAMTLDDVFVLIADEMHGLSEVVRAEAPPY